MECIRPAEGPEPRNAPREGLESVSPILTAALGYVRRSVGVVPLRSRLASDRDGRLSPIPLIRWQCDGPLTTVAEVGDFWREVPDAQLAIRLGGGMAAVDVDTKNLPEGGPPPDRPIPAAPPGAYVESTKSGGLHYLFVIRGDAPSGVSRRVIHLGGYVDLLADGILVVAPSSFTNSPRGYEVVSPGGFPVFHSMESALRTFAPWLLEAYTERRLRAGRTAPPPGRTVTATADPRPCQEADEGEVSRALAFLKTDAGASQAFSTGIRMEGGRVDRSLTEFQIVKSLKQAGFSAEATWSVVSRAPHTKSPRDRRGRTYFEEQIWGKIR